MRRYLIDINSLALSSSHDVLSKSIGVMCMPIRNEPLCDILFQADDRLGILSEGSMVEINAALML